MPVYTAFFQRQFAFLGFETCKIRLRNIEILIFELCKLVKIICAICTENFMRIFLILPIDRIFFGEKPYNIRQNRRFLCPFQGFSGHFHPMQGRAWAGKRQGRKQGRDRIVKRNSLTKAVLSEKVGHTGKNRAGHGQGMGTGKRQHNRALCCLLRLKSNITSNQLYPYHLTS